MERIIVNFVNIIDFVNKKSRKINFTDGINVVTSDKTSRGKSSILRAIYHSLGANSAYDKEFKANDKMFQIEFTSGINMYEMIRYKNYFIIRKNDEIIKKIEKDYKELACFFEKEFNTAIYLTNKNFEFDIAPVSYCFIPYFLDQDYSWKKEILPFNNMEQFVSASNTQLYYYHLNVLDNNYYKIKTKLLKLKSDKDKINIVVKDLSDDLTKIKEMHKIGNVSIDEENAKVNLTLLKNELEKYLSINSSLQNEIYSLENLNVKITIHLSEIDELIGKLKKKEEKQSHMTVECPKCSEVFKVNAPSDFYNNYSIELLIENRKSLVVDLDENSRILNIKKNEYLNLSKTINTISKKYNDQNNLFEQYLKTNAIKILNKEKEQILFEKILKIESLQSEINELSKSIEAYDSNTRQINSLFKNIYIENLNSLGLDNINRENIDNFRKYVISGSQYCRSTLAFFFTFLKIKDQINPNEYRFPIVLDSPFEGDQDLNNKSDIVVALKNYYNSRKENQIFVGLREARKFFDSSYNIIELENEKGSVLLESEYQNNENDIETVKSLFFNSINLKNS